MRQNIFLEELKLRNCLQDFSSGLLTNRDSRLKGYCGFDLTASSLQVGNLATIMLLKRFQSFGHEGYALLGGATSLIGDPSFKKEERQLISPDEIAHRKEKIAVQLQKLLASENSAEVKILDNAEWFAKMNLIDFLRNTGKYITINYMQAKESVKARMTTGISYAEFTYQLFQAYDFLHLYKTYGISLQMGGADQWGNLTAGMELSRKKLGVSLHALTIPLVTKSNGEKFGKSESGRGLWLDNKMTSPYEFYQFWVNVGDLEASKYMRIFTLKDLQEIKSIEELHTKNPEKRILQKSLAKEVTSFVHSREAFERAKSNSEILFDNSTSLQEIPIEDLEDIFYNVPKFEISSDLLERDLSDVVLENCNGKIFSSRSDFRRSVKEGSFYVNKKKYSEEYRSPMLAHLLHERYIVLQRGKKNYFFLKLV